MKATRPTPESILKLRRRVDAWRQTRSARGPMPESLWAEAGALARQHGIYAVSRGARLAYDGVKKRAKAAGPRRMSPPTSLAGAFVELPVASLSGGQGPDAAVVELRDARGRSLTVRVMPQALSQLPEVATTLWGLS
jgi:hypothetical protein